MAQVDTLIERTCAWCSGPIGRAARRDAETCSKACRQAKHRFRVGPGPIARGARMSFAYADPPYPKLAARYYKDQPTFAGEVDHAILIDELRAGYPNGWALSTSAAALPDVLRLCPSGVRVAIWVKGSRKGAAWRARNAYEPVIIWGGRPRRMTCHEDLDDVLLWGGRQHSHPGALVGMKSAAFCEWLFRQLGAARGDALLDVFPGSGAVGRAWELYAGGTLIGPREAAPAPRVPSRLQQASRAAAGRIDPQQRLRLASTDDA